MKKLIQKTIIEELKEEASEIHARIRLIQSQCAHPLVVRTTKNKSDTGNWDRGQDSYWTEHECGLCQLRWQTDQDWKRIGDKRGMPKDAS